MNFLRKWFGLPPGPKKTPVFYRYPYSAALRRGHIRTYPSGLRTLRTTNSEEYPLDLPADCTGLPLRGTADDGDIRWWRI